MVTQHKTWQQQKSLCYFVATSLKDPSSSVACISWATTISYVGTSGKRFLNKKICPLKDLQGGAKMLLKLIQKLDNFA